MRISVEKHDPGFESWLKRPNRHSTRVLLDGVEITHAISADTDLGEVVRYVHDDRGRILIRDHVAVRETLRGVVTLE